jgi:hypothetical protein
MFSMFLVTGGETDVAVERAEAANALGTVASPVVRLEVVPQLTHYSLNELRSVRVVGNFGYEYDLQASGDLRTWSTIEKFTPFEGSAYFPLDLLGLTNFPFQFFRSVELPR